MTDWTKCKLVPVEATPEMRDVFTAAEGSATHYTHTTIRCVLCDQFARQIVDFVERKWPSKNATRQNGF